MGEENQKNKSCDCDKLILVYYIDVRTINYDDVGSYIKQIMEKVTIKMPIIGEIIAIPIYGETRIECINPKYITEKELIREHRLKLDKLHEMLDNYIMQKENEDER
jgi:hypothetical protein